MSSYDVAQIYYYRPQTNFAKAMFLQVSVCPQGEGVPAPGGCGPGGCLLRGRVGCSGGLPVPGGCACRRPPTAAGGTHPTGMHSCLTNVLQKRHENERNSTERGFMSLVPHLDPPMCTAKIHFDPSIGSICSNVQIPNSLI